MNLQRKILEFIIIEHSLLKLFTIKEAIILKVIYMKANNRKLNRFPYSKNSIHSMSGVSVNTVSKALIKFKKYSIIN